MKLERLITYGVRLCLDECIKDMGATEFGYDMSRRVEAMFSYALQLFLCYNLLKPFLTYDNRKTIGRQLSFKEQNVGYVYDGLDFVSFLCYGSSIVFIWILQCLRIWTMDN